MTWDHFLSCPDLRRRSVDEAHSFVGRAFERMGEAAGCVLRWDPSSTAHDGTRDRPDFCGWAPDGQPITADVERGHPAATTYAGLAARRNGYLCETEAKAKKAKYRQLVLERGGLWFGLTVETMGRLSQDSQRFTKQCAPAGPRSAADARGRSPPFHARFAADLQLAIVRGNDAHPRRRCTTDP